MDSLFSSFFNDDFNDLEELFGGFDVFPKAVKYTAAPQKKCPVCGHTLADFERYGKLGCGECYNTFRDYVRPTLKRIHSGSVHSGKLPSKSESELKLKRKYEQLKKQLSEAVSGEDYETAARLHKQLKEMESDMK